MNKYPNKQKKRRSPRQANTVRFPLPFVMLLCWMRSYAGEEECSCGASPDYEIELAPVWWIIRNFRAVDTTPVRK